MIGSMQHCETGMASVEKPANQQLHPKVSVLVMASDSDKPSSAGNQQISLSRGFVRTLSLLPISAIGHRYRYPCVVARQNLITITGLPSVGGCLAQHPPCLSAPPSPSAQSSSSLPLTEPADELPPGPSSASQPACTARVKYAAASTTIAHISKAALIYSNWSSKCSYWLDSTSLLVWSPEAALQQFFPACFKSLRQKRHQAMQSCTMRMTHTTPSDCASYV